MSNADEPAYPVAELSMLDGSFVSQHWGLTKREAFAMAAMQGMCADPERNGDYASYAKDAVGFADALLDELEKAR